MKKISSLIIACAAFLSLTACTSPAEQVMAPLNYDKPISTHVNQKAALYWQSGAQQSSVEPRHVSNNNIGGSLPVAIASQTLQAAAETVVRKNNPGRFTYTYGKAQQAVFITSLKDVLQKKRVFTDTSLVSDPQQINAKDVLITINFKSTRVLDVEDENHRIVLDVEMTIQTAKKPVFKHTYVVQSSEEVSNFKAQQEDVSQRLLDKVIKGIKQWAAENK